MYRDENNLDIAVNCEIVSVNGNLGLNYEPDVN